MGDTAGDIREAREAGVTPVGVAWGWHEPELLLEAGAERVAVTPAELLTILAPELAHDFFGAEAPPRLLRTPARADARECLRACLAEPARVVQRHDAGGVEQHELRAQAARVADEPARAGSRTASPCGSRGTAGSRACRRLSSPGTAARAATG